MIRNEKIFTTDSLGTSFNYCTVIATEEREYVIIVVNDVHFDETIEICFNKETAINFINHLKKLI